MVRALDDVPVTNIECFFREKVFSCLSINFVDIFKILYSAHRILVDTSLKRPTAGVGRLKEKRLRVNIH